ncbi:MAG: hypothetical protein QW341_03930 [Candidatus Bathyarchaeia archaeon]
MGRLRVKPLQEIVNRYAESALISAIRLRRYWLSQGLSEDEAISRAVKQAVGMMKASGRKPEELLELFRELHEASKAFITMLEKVVKKSGEAE